MPTHTTLAHTLMYACSQPGSSPTLRILFPAPFGSSSNINFGELTHIVVSQFSNITKSKCRPSKVLVVCEISDGSSVAYAQRSFVRTQ